MEMVKMKKRYDMMNIKKERERLEYEIKPK